MKMNICFDTDVVKENLKTLKAEKKAQLAELRDQKKKEKADKKFNRDIDRLKKAQIKVGISAADAITVCNKITEQHSIITSQVIES